MRSDKAQDGKLGLKMMVYGPPGVGKTVFLSSVVDDERTFPALMLDLEAGTLSIRSKIRVLEYDQLGKPEKGYLDTYRVRGWNDMVRVYDDLWAGKLPYKTLVVDSLSEINQMNLIHVATKGAQQRPSLKQTVVPEIRDYLISNTTMTELLRGLRDLESLHVICTALQEAEKTEEDAVIQIQPLLSGKLSRRALALFDIVGHMSVDSVSKKRVLVCQPTARVIAKDRTEGGKLGGKVENPTVSKILDLIGY